MDEEVLVLNNKVVEDNGLFNNYGTTLYDLSKKDYPRKEYFDKFRMIKCIGLDEFEASVRCERDKTMDAAIGVSCFNRGRVSSPHLLLVELRMGYNSSKNLSMSNMLSKSIHSRDLLGYDTVVDKRDYYVFDDAIIQQAKSYFERGKKEIRGTDNMYAVSVTELTSTCIIVQMPAPDAIDMNPEICVCSNYVATKDWGAVLKRLDYWQKQYSSRLNANDLYNARPIKEYIMTICDVMEQHRWEFKDTDDELDFDIFKESNPYFFN